jgi:hypothetical protein
VALSAALSADPLTRNRTEAATDAPPTCGKGLAAHAVVPQTLGAVLGATADVLENHIRSLDPTDAKARQERQAYERLVRDHRAIVAALEALAVAMSGYRDLPMAPHDETVLADQPSRAVFATLLQAEERASELLRTMLAQHKAMAPPQR